MMNKLVFGEIEVSKKEFHGSKESIKLKDVFVDNIIASGKVKGNFKVLYWI